MTDLFSPLPLRAITLPNRLVVSPMCQYSAAEGMVNDWHFAHLSRFALGGFGTVMVEASAVTPEGRISPGDVGIWNDSQAGALARIATFLKSQGTIAAIQLAHAGRKASTRRPWHGGTALDAGDLRQRGEVAWQTVAPSVLAHADDYPQPVALDEAGMEAICQAFVDATRRAEAAGFDMVEVHCAHGYLLHQFLSPLSNQRDDAYGGSLQHRMRFPLRVIAAVRKAWPDDKPLLVRISAIDAAAGGWQLDDSVEFCHALKALGVDVVDCSSGGITSSYEGPGGPGYQVPYARRIREQTGVATMAVGLITDPRQAQSIINNGDADLVALARQALVDPQWPLHAEKQLGGDPTDFSRWPLQSASRLAARAKSLARHG
ncbi:NADH:flavin oxidoreductase/NADH oxidase [Pseudoxanthomonas dokdonensis]|uniref:NADH:flavin oxidoreductase/NADH oxidase N-terminal domain-containing protein n=1 Tax=Pseudoxanthomonas dokdonensis TaxID=344882 RepID=A0A0R0CRK4_9GAMM|nr:NADH:flavin oxidoreductase/NADH oxidase [Pseudoxanthomonas dokdonensis]KRG68305.1 hypothetical protein ABB29_13335 [Pseudoxanthomonas dokdonensis]